MYEHKLRAVMQWVAKIVELPFGLWGVFNSGHKYSPSGNCIINRKVMSNGPTKSLAFQRSR